MNRGTAGVLVLGVVGLAAAAVLFAGLVGGSVTTSTSTEIPFDSIPTDGTAIVFSKAQEGGFEFIGIRIQRPSHTLDVGLAVPPECIDVDPGGDERLRDDGACAELPASGAIVGGGITAGGDRVVVVRIAVDEDCADAVPFGATWPSDLAACAGS